jgi:hypothetical protein
VSKKFSLLLLFNKISASSAVVHALNAKGLDTVAVDNNKDFISFINKHSFDLIGLSVNHPNESAIAKVLTDGNQIPFFNFAEDSEKVTTEKLRSATGKVKIPGATSSYTIWLNIASFVKEKSDTNASSGKVIVFGPKEENEELGTVNVAEAAAIREGKIIIAETPAPNEDGQIVVAEAAPTREGEIIMVEVPTATSAGGIVRVVEDEEIRVGKIATPISRHLSDHFLQVLAPWQGHLLKATEKSFPPVQSLKVVPIHNDGEKGLLIFAGDHQIEISDIESLKQKICNNKKPSEIECGDFYEFEISSTDIMRWSLENCLFSYVYSDHCRMLVSYLKRDKIYPDFIRTEDGEMCGVNIEDLPPVPFLDFDLYIYFNRNERILPYIKHGDSINQEKLQSKPGLKMLYCKNEDCGKLTRLFIDVAVRKMFKNPKAKSPSL